MEGMTTRSAYRQASAPLNDEIVVLPPRLSGRKRKIDSEDLFQNMEESKNSRPRVFNETNIISDSDLSQQVSQENAPQKAVSISEQTPVAYVTPVSSFSVTLPLPVPLPKFSDMMPQAHHFAPLVSTAQWKADEDPAYILSTLRHKFEQEQSMVFKEPVYKKQSVFNNKGHDNMFSFMQSQQSDDTVSYTTFLHAVMLFDQVFYRYNIPRTDIWLVISACFMLSSKFEEIYAPDPENLQILTHYTFSRELLQQKERHILEIMKFQIGLPTRMEFAEYFMRFLDTPPKQRHLVHYLIGLSLTDVNFNYERGSVVAAACIHLARQLLSKITRADTDKISLFANCTLEQLVRTVARLRHVHAEARKDTAVASVGLVNYFSSEERMFVAEVTAIPERSLNFGMPIPSADWYQLINRCGTVSSFGLDDYNCI